MGLAVRPTCSSIQWREPLHQCRDRAWLVIRQSDEKVYRAGYKVGLVCSSCDCMLLFSSAWFNESDSLSANCNNIGIFLRNTSCSGRLRLLWHLRFALICSARLLAYFNAWYRCRRHVCHMQCPRPSLNKSQSRIETQRSYEACRTLNNHNHAHKLPCFLEWIYSKYPCYQELLFLLSCYHSDALPVSSHTFRPIHVLGF